MLKLPTTKDNAEKSTTNENIPDEGNVSFGFHTDMSMLSNEGEMDTKYLRSKRSGDIQQEQGKMNDGDTMKLMHTRAKYLSSELCGLITQLQTTVQDACEVTHAHVKIQKQVCDEVELIVETSVKFCEQLISKVISLSDKLDNLDELGANVDRVERTLIEYEKTALELIKRRRKRRELEKLKKK